MNGSGEEHLESEPVLSPAGIDHKVKRIAFEILDRAGDRAPVFVGILKRGVPVAERVRSVLSAELGDGAIPLGTLDINLYRDDLDNLGGNVPSLAGSDFPFEVEGAHVILFDDVLFTGRTVRAAIEGIMAFGRPARIELAVLVDRGNRELPIQADYVGETVPTSCDEHIRVRLREIDGEDGVFRLRDRRA